MLHQHPALAEADVVGVPDEYWGESLRTFVVVRPGAEVSEAGIGEHWRAALPGYKVPRSVRFIDALPRKPGGKVMKDELRGG